MSLNRTFLAGANNSIPAGIADQAGHSIQFDAVTWHFQAIPRAVITRIGFPSPDRKQKVPYASESRMQWRFSK
jgi:hypothetical protein